MATIPLAGPPHTLAPAIARDPAKAAASERPFVRPGRGGPRGAPDGTDFDDDFFVKDGFCAEAEVPVGQLSLIGCWDGLRRNGNVLVSSDLASYSYMLRYTAALAVKLKSGIRLKTSAEYYQFSDFGNDVAVHLGVATPF